MTAGVCRADFLDYIVKLHYRLVRRRAIGNLREKLNGYAQQLLSEKEGNIQILQLSEERRRELQSMLASYLGHFSHANSRTLLIDLFRCYP